MHGHWQSLHDKYLWCYHVVPFDRISRIRIVLNAHGDVMQLSEDVQLDLATENTLTVLHWFQRLQRCHTI